MSIWLFDLDWTAQLASHHGPTDVARIRARILELMDDRGLDDDLSYDAEQRIFSFRFTGECGDSTEAALCAFSQRLAQEEGIDIHYHWEPEHADCFDMQFGPEAGPTL